MTRDLINKKILLGVSGGIAAYKTTYLIRQLVQSGAEVKVIMTPTATHFVTPLTLSVLSKNEVLTEAFSAQGNWNNHVELAMWCDVMVIAPATSNTISKMASGSCDNLLLATYLSAKSPVIIAPAMDLDMAVHPTLMRNLEQLQSDGVQIIPYEEGELASGLSGPGRMAEPETIFQELKKVLLPEPDFRDVPVMITAGPTHESIDPVRFIGNRSTGKMGVAIANEMAKRGCDVHLILGPTEIDHKIHPTVKIVRVTSAEEMNDACSALFSEMKIAVLSAAVADFRPESKSDQKIKKSSDSLDIHLVKTADILAGLGSKKSPDQLLIGFALETENEMENARGKLQKKNLDLIVLNSLNDEGAGFGYDTNKITTISKSGEVHNFGLRKKTEVARDIVDQIKELLTVA
ncbi:MAG: bifunctional phosphopantothenoylcysteine decarboxylase/phosphopantothenate--cysteine ligase CoaBC [Bacteroidetes bacterium]|nr:bifunctional phosphopantothenoylcysteine decarboxylase/phosphopantothenate--cysteine ligase CoaBC [Bacteroidota bacterium]